jgi:hypothetical protein
MRHHSRRPNDAHAVLLHYGHTTGLILNTEIKTKSQKIQGTVLYYLGFKYSITKINFKSDEILKFFLQSFL